MKKIAKSSVQQWAEKIDWAKRIKAVCKPCWELRYCPYGPLVEHFSLPEEIRTGLVGYLDMNVQFSL